MENSTQSFWTRPICSYEYNVVLDVFTSTSCLQKPPFVPVSLPSPFRGLGSNSFYLYLPLLKVLTILPSLTEDQRPHQSDLRNTAGIELIFTTTDSDVNPKEGKQEQLF
jgi:hypothetical protein